jgi:hypothetical protein
MANRYAIPTARLALQSLAIGAQQNDFPSNPDMQHD